MADTMNLWPLLRCLISGHGQTFARRLVKRGHAVGLCDVCKQQRTWERVRLELDVAEFLNTPLTA